MSADAVRALEELRDSLAKAMYAYFMRTVALDAWINGTMDAELAPLDPNVPEQNEERKRIAASHQMEHSLMVGQRLALNGYLAAGVAEIDEAIARETDRA